MSSAPVISPYGRTLDHSGSDEPLVPDSVRATGLTEEFIVDLLLKTPIGQEHVLREAGFVEVPGRDTFELPEKAPLANQVDFVRAGPEGDVIAEEARLLMAVGMAANPGDQLRVVDRRALLLAQPEPLREMQADDRCAQDVLGGLSKPEVDRQRHRADQLGKAQSGVVEVLGCRGHVGASVSSKSERPRSGGGGWTGWHVNEHP